MSPPAPLARRLGLGTMTLLGMGVAIGSGIFRTPGLVAEALGSGPAMLLLWAFGGLFTLASGLVSAELATRFPSAGGEYVYLREAYGRFAAFLYGWSATVFLVAGGVASIAVALGEVVVELTGGGSAGAVAVAAIVVVSAVNALGLREGAGVQNVLTVAKLVGVVGVGLVALWPGEVPVPASGRPVGGGSWVAAFLPVLWAYAGATDGVKLAEEVRDVARALPRALIYAALSVTLLYVGLNACFLVALPVEAIAASRFVASDLLSARLGEPGRVVMSLVMIAIFAGALGSTLLATVRVPFATARDGFGLSFAGRMSARQSPVGAIALVAALASAFALSRGFRALLDLYFLASAVLFGLTYASLLVFRARDRGPPPPGVFRCPGGVPLALALVLLEVAIGVDIVRTSPRDSALTLGLFLALGGVYALRFRAKA